MNDVTDETLIKAAERVLNAQIIDQTHEDYAADVGCALQAANGEIYTGVCVGGGLSVCAEQTATANMLSKTGPVITRIVAVWRDEAGTLQVLPPCGRCREFLRIISQDNLETTVILGKDHTAQLKDLLLYHGWHAEPAL